MTTPQAEDPKEKFLRAELNSLAERMHRLFQWGVTLLLTLETAFFFVRKEAAERAGLAPGSPFPIQRHLIGTTIILFLAIVFIFLHHGLSKLYKQYFVQLYDAKNLKSPCGITAPKLRWKTQWALDLVVIVFPIFDLGLGYANSQFPLRAPATSANAQVAQSLPVTITVAAAQPPSSAGPITTSIAPTPTPASQPPP